MVADSIKHFVHALISGVLLARRIKGFGSQNLLLTFAKTLTASLIMGGVAWVTLPMLSTIIGTSGIIREALLVVAGGVIYGGIFLVVAMLLKITELRWIGSLVYKRLRG
jgi:peptidoglycan biosynthesis protein MviN/MurJ (putative lipid II flippase)